ncbi:MAG TPA: hypothetical protein VFF64_11360 [Candidatus Eremiobacteraceae bacterium]|nr:hypothetical protein [Candidatus Eremiobacteraceae bacterium]
MSSFQENIAAAILTRIRERRASRTASERDRQRRSPAVAPAKLREATFADFDKVAKLKKRSDIVADSPENWNRLWRRNPALAQSKVNRPIGWVLEADGQVVGYLGNISLTCRYGDRTLTAVATHGFAVDPPYRAVALSLASAYYRQKSVDLHLSTSAIEASGKIAIAFKCAALPQPDYAPVLFWVLRPYSFARALMRKLNVNPLLSPICTVFAALAIGSDKIFRRRWPRQSAARLAVSEISPDDIGNDFQTLWTEKLNERCRLYADRTPATLRWHFDIPGDRGLARVLCCHKEGKLCGYAVVRSDTDPKNGLRKSIIADMIATQDDPAVIKALWVAAYEHARNAGSHILEVQGFPSDIRALSSDWRPYQRKYPACPYYYKAADPELHKTLGDEAAWYACPFDGDATLIRPSYSRSAPNFTLEEPMEAAHNDVAVDVPESERTEVV